MALTTTFKKSIPYNTIRLVGDVAQWAQTEQSYADNTNIPLIINTTDVSMADLQRASGANIDPGDGIMSSGSLGNMRYGVAVLSDLSAGDGVYTNQISNANQASQFVQTREWNLASNPIDVSLGKLAQWDYTANLEMPDIDKFDIETSTTADWRATACGKELFIDTPIYAWGARNSTTTSTRKVYLVRSHPNGGRYSSYAISNYLEVNHVSDMNDIQTVVSLRREYGRTLGTNIRSFITLGRRSTTTGNLKAGIYYINIGTGNTWSAASSATGNITTQFGSNSVARHGGYLKDDLVAVVASRASGGTDLVRVSTSGGTVSSSYLSLNTASTYGAGDGVVTIYDSAGTLPLAFPIWMESQSTYNRYVKIRGYDMSSGISAYGSNTLTVFDSSNTFKGCGGALLNAGANSTANPHVFLVWATDSSGDLRLQVVQMANGTLSITGFPSTTIPYGDTNLTDFVEISPLTAVEKTNVTVSAEVFQPGGSNNYKKRRYFVISVGTNQSTDTNQLYYGYYDIGNNTLSTWDGGSFTGREMRMAQNDFDTDGRAYARSMYYRGEAGAAWMPFLGGRYINSSDRRLTFGMTALDYKPIWSGLATSDPGSTFYDQSGITGTGNFYYDEANVDEPNWEVEGRWYILGPHPLYPGNTDNIIKFSDQYNNSGPVYSGSLSITFQSEDIDGYIWDDFMNTVNSYNQSGNPVYIRVRTGAPTKTAYFTLIANNQPKPYIWSSAGVGHYIDFQGVSNNGHSGDNFSFQWNLTTGTTKNAVAMTFKQSPF